MSWQLFLTIAIFSDVAGRLLQRLLMKEKESDPIAYAIVYQIIGGIFLGVFAIIHGFRIPPLGPIMLNLLFMPLIWALSNVLGFRALKITEASIYSILFTTHTIWIILGAMLFLGESFSLPQVVGTLLILGSVILISWKHADIRFRRGELITLLSALAFALGILSDTRVVATFDVPSYLTLGYIFPAFFLWGIYYQKTNAVVALVKSPKLKKVALMAVLYATAGLTYYYAYFYGRNAAQISSILQITTVLTVIAAVIFLKEYSQLRLKFLATAISFIGVLLVS